MTYFNIQSATTDWIKRAKETVLEFVVTKDDLIEDVIQ